MKSSIAQMSKLRSPINYKSLQLELQEALRADELYRLQNDAKLRAVEQNVPTYEDFRGMVNAAHLKPLKRDNAEPKIKRLWNPIASDLNSAMSFDESTETQKPKTDLELLNVNGNFLRNKVPTTCEQFIQVWKTVKGREAKFHYLKSLRHDLRVKIFRTEIPSELLVEIIDICLQSASVKDNIEPIVQILHNLSKCNRFSLTVNFMEQNEKDMCTRLFSDLLISAENQNNIAADAIKALALVYEVVIE